MTGPEHYREAERLLLLAESPLGAAMLADGYDVTAQAQAHATLALAAAQVEAVAARGPGDVEREWMDVVWATSAPDEGAGA